MANAVHTQSLAKTTRPAVPATLIERPRLFERLDSGCAGPAIWIHGPPGAGKTCLVASYLEVRGLDAVWYQLDAGDRDVTRFHARLHAAIERHLGSALERSSTRTTGRTTARDIGHDDVRARVRNLFAHCREPFVLVLDDCHELPATSALHQTLAIVVEEIPRHATAVFLAREVPPASMSPLRVRDALMTIGAAELCVSRDELVLMAEARGVSLDDATVRSMLERSDGWTAALVLMIEHVRSGGAVTRTPQGLAPQVVFDYLATEVFATFEPIVQEILCRIAFLPRMSAALASEVSTHEQAEQVLENLARNSYFMTRLDDETQTQYELHPLFRSFLIKRAQRTLDPAEASEHVRVAARWLERNDRILDAIALLADANDYEALADSMRWPSEVLGDAADTGELERWLMRVPPSDRDAHPWLVYWHARCLLRQDPRGARRGFEHAHARFSGVDESDSDGAALSACGAVQAIVDELDDLSLLDAWLPALEYQLRASKSLAPAHLHLLHRQRFVALALRGPSADLSDDQCTAMIATRGDDQEDPNADALRCLVASMRADFNAAARLLDTSAPDDEAVSLGLARAFLFLLRGERTACMRAVEHARRGLERTPSALHALLANAIERSADLALECTPSNVGADDDRWHEVSASEGPARLRSALTSYLHGRRLMADARFLDAFHAYRAAEAAAADIGLGPLVALCALGVTESAAAAGDVSGAMQALGRVDDAMPAGLIVLEFLRHAQRARVAELDDDASTSAAALESAFALGRAHGLRFAVGPCRASAAALCAKALDAGIEPDYAVSLIRAHDLVASAPDDAPSTWPWPLRVLCLGGLTVLRDDAPIKLSGKGEGRPLELLKLLLALGARNVPQEQLAQTLWPHVDGDYAYRSFTSTLYRLRKLLGVADAVIVQEGRVSLNPACCWVDALFLEQRLSGIESAVWSASPGAGDEPLAHLAQILLETHRGPFLGDDDQQPAFVARRAQLRRRLLRGLMRLGARFYEAGDEERAIALFQDALEADPGAEGYYRELMLLLERCGRRSEVLEVYQICRAALATAGGARPGPEIEDVARRQA